MKKYSSEKVRYNLNSQGIFTIEGYNHGKPFSNFFPGIAGTWGVPMWVFYVNRGQCISSLGIEGKDKAILEFQPANKAYRLTSLNGFRTFIKIRKPNEVIFWEPFQNNFKQPYQTTQKMLITSHDLTLEDVNLDLGLKAEVNYFTMPEEPFAALVRRLRITNLSRKKYHMEIIDGLPAIVPFGLRDWALKNMSRTAEAWVKVCRLEQKTPFYRLAVEISDTSKVKHIKEGNFYFSFCQQSGGKKLLSPLVEASCVFGQSDDFAVPERFLGADLFKVPAVQQTNNRTPSAMSFGAFAMEGHDKKDIISLIGYAKEEGQLDQIVNQARRKDFCEKKAQTNEAIVQAVKDQALTISSSQDFDLYSGQNFLDNVLRGGLPVSLLTEEGKVAFNVYSRKHGDLERDYNHFVLSPTYFSQGNGNFRDVNQNRRNDVWFNDDVKQSNLVNFLSLIQADGYNPLIVRGMTFIAGDTQKTEGILSQCVGEKGSDILREHLKRGFQPGELLKFIDDEEIELKVHPKIFIERILGACRKHEAADHGEGFWTDHWTYNLDLLESYLSVYPEERWALLLNKKEFTFYHNSHYVLPRDQRYIVINNYVRQYHSVFHDGKTIKADEAGNKLRVENGRGAVYYTHLLGKLLCIIVNKVASLDPSGIGIEMEADKPNWYDALNGLPGLLGSSISETLELKRVCVFLLKSIEHVDWKDDAKVSLFAELHTFITRLAHILSVESDPLSYWMKANDIKEHYRYRIRHGIEGQESEMTAAEIKNFLRLVIEKVNKAASLGRTKSGLCATYFFHEVVEYEAFDKYHAQGVPYVRPLKFKRYTLPLFLEGAVHHLRVVKGPEEARKIYKKVRRSALFDHKLKMYKVNADLSGETEEIGRARIFPRGWLENESIWMHMQYKFLLELLRCGLHEEFFDNFRKALVPFLKPEQYGRSNLENSSFIVSSAHPDADLHGRGFVARLSGSTAEFLHIWLLMNIGRQPFSWDEKTGLSLTFRPILPGWLFTKKNTVIDFFNGHGQKESIRLPKNIYAFMFRRSTLVVYHNPRRRNTFSQERCRVKKIQLTYHNKSVPVSLQQATIASPYAEDIRSNKVKQIDVYFD